MSDREKPDALSRIILICKPEQSGKTFVMIKIINKDLSDDFEKDKTVVNIIFCDNSLLLTKQTCVRVSRDVIKIHETNDNYIEFSSRKDGISQRNSYGVYHKIVSDGITNIICCTNGKRVTDISTIINDINKGQYTKGKFIFKIWIDEADKFNKHIVNTFVPLMEENPNVYCYCLTATPDTLFRKNRYMRVLPLKYTTSQQYHGWCDNHIEIRENEHGSTEGFALQIVNEVKESFGGCLPKGTKWFIPADRKKSSHEMMRNILTRNGFAVFTINGNGIELSLPDNTSVLEDKTRELHEQIREMYSEYNLDRFPVAITGYICVGRGISIMHPEDDYFDEFIFDYGIFSNCSNKAEASQNAGRLKGNYKHWQGYKPPTVFTTEKFNKIAVEWELRSRELAKIAFSRNTVEPSIITKHEYNGITKTDIEYKIFKTWTELKEECTRMKYRIRKPINIDKDGFYKTSLNQKSRKISLKEAIEARYRSYGKNSNKEKIWRRYYPCYENINDKSTLVYLMIIEPNN